MDNDIDINKLKSELLDLKSSNVLNESRIRKLTAERDSILRENEDLKNQLMILENNLNSLKITFSDKAKDFSENEDRIDQLRADINSLESKNKELEKQIDKLKLENSNLNLDLQMVKSEKSYLDSELNKAYSEIEDLKSAKKSDFDLPEDESLDNEIRLLLKLLLILSKSSLKLICLILFKFWLMKKRKNWKRYIIGIL